MIKEKDLRHNSISVRKLFKKVLGIFTIMAVAAALSACQGGEKKVSAENTDTSEKIMLYDEKEIGVQAGLKIPRAFRVNSKNLPVFFDNEENKGRFITLDSEGKVQGEIKCALKGQMVAFDLDANDNIFAVITEYNQKGTLQKVCEIDSEGKVKNEYELGKLDFKNQKEMQSIANDISVAANGKIYISTLNGIYVLDSSGKLDKKIGKDSYRGIATDSDSNILTLSYLEGKYSLLKLDGSNGDKLWVNSELERPEASNIDSSKVRYDSVRKMIYVQDSYGIDSFDNAGKKLERLLNFKNYTLLYSGYSPEDFYIDQSGYSYVLTKYEGKYEVFRYDLKSEKHEGKQRKTVTVAVPYPERWLEMAALKFQKVNPDFRIEIKKYEERADENNNYDKYVKALNTELLTGEGPDIIRTDALSYEKYADKNLLSDIGKMIEADKVFDRSSYFTNIFEAVKYRDKLYALPASVKFWVLSADKSILEKEGLNIDDLSWTWEDFNRIGQGLSKDRKMFVSMPMISLMNYMMKGNIGNFLNETEKKAAFDSSEFINLLNMAKRYGDGKVPANEAVANANFNDVEAVQKGSVIFNPVDIRDYIGYAFIKSMYKEQARLLEFPAVGKHKGKVFDSTAIFSINNNSKNKEAAWEFLKFILSDEIQADNLGGFPVNRRALEKTAQNAMDATKNGGMSFGVSSKDNGAPIMFEAKELKREDIDYINSFIERMGSYNSDNSGVNTIIETEALPFFSGQKTAEEAAGLIQQKVNIYLGE